MALVLNQDKRRKQINKIINRSWKGYSNWRFKRIDIKYCKSKIFVIITRRGIFWYRIDINDGWKTIYFKRRQDIIRLRNKF